MEFTVIGYWGAYPEKGGATSCYLLQKDGFNLLIDCGSGALSRLPFYKQVSDLDAVVLSHYHQDHIADIGVLQYSMLVYNQLHGSDRTLPVYGHSDNETAFSNLSHHAVKGIAYDPVIGAEIGPFQLSFFKTVHPVTCYGMRITDGKRTVVYTADTSYSEKWIPFCKHADLLVAESSFYEGQDGSGAGHMNSKEAAEIADKAGVGELLLTHLPHFGKVEKLKMEAGRYYGGKISLAEEGWTWRRG